MRKLLWVILSLVLVLAALLGVTYWQLDRIVRDAAQRGTSYALGVDSEVASARIGLFTGRIGLGDLKLHNPPDFQTPFLMTSEEVIAHTTPSSVFSDTVKIPRIEINGLTLHVEQQRGTSNLEVVMEHARQIAERDETAEAPETERKLRVDHVVVRNIVAHVQTLPVGGEVSTITVRVPKLEFHDVTSKEGRSLAVAGLTRRLFPAIVIGVLNKGGELPVALVVQVGGGAARLLGQLGGDGIVLLEQVGGPVAKLLIGALEQAVQSGGDVGNALGEALDQTLGKALNDLFGGSDSESNPDENGRESDGSAGEGLKDLLSPEDNSASK